MNREDVLAHLRTVEKAAYPRHYREMQGVWTWNDLTSYCEGEPFVRTWDGGYVLWTSDAIVDLASTTHVSLATFRGIIRAMAVTCGGVVEASWASWRFSVKGPMTGRAKRSTTSACGSPRTLESNTVPRSSGKRTAIRLLARRKAGCGVPKSTPPYP